MYEAIGIVDLCGPSAESKARNRWAPLLTRSLAGQPLVTWAIRRMSDALQLDLVVAIVPTHPANSEVTKRVPPDIAIFPCDAPDALGRLAAVVGAYPTQGLVRTQMNWPLVDPVLVDGILRAANSGQRCDYASYCSNDGRPAILSNVGLFAEWCRTAAIERANESCNDPIHREHGTSFLYSNPQDFRLRLVPAPAALDRQDLRLALADGLDIDNLEDILEALGPDHLDWQEIVDLIESHPELRQRMANRNRTQAADPSSKSASRNSS